MGEDGREVWGERRAEHERRPEQRERGRQERAMYKHKMSQQRREQDMGEDADADRKESN